MYGRHERRKKHGWWAQRQLMAVPVNAAVLLWHVHTPQTAIQINCKHRTFHLMNGPPRNDFVQFILGPAQNTCGNVVCEAERPIAIENHIKIDDNLVCQLRQFHKIMMFQKLPFCCLSSPRHLSARARFSGADLKFAMHTSINDE